jgi:alpha-tubulin suppressor-like RCC1 family protein
MPTFYNYRENGGTYSFDDVFVPADAFRQGRLWNWGGNSIGQLGDNTTIGRSTPVTTFVGGANWKQVSSAHGASHTVAIKTDGTLWTWGYNISGQLGINISLSDRFTPVTTFIGGSDWKQVSGGTFHTAAIKTDGTLWTWGRNNSGQLGNNTTDNKLTPVTTFAGGTNWKQVSSGANHTAAIKTDGTLWTWGDNTDGELGINNATGPICTPITTFTGGTNWKQVASGTSHTVAVTYIDDYQ